jgi:hypothetical protein
VRAQTTIFVVVCCPYTHTQTHTHTFTIRAALEGVGLAYIIKSEPITWLQCIIRTRIHTHTHTHAASGYSPRRRSSQKHQARTRNMALMYSHARAYTHTHTHTIQATLQGVGLANNTKPEPITWLEAFKQAVGFSEFTQNVPAPLETAAELLQRVGREVLPFGNVGGAESYNSSHLAPGVCDIGEIQSVTVPGAILQVCVRVCMCAHRACMHVCMCAHRACMHVCMCAHRACVHISPFHPYHIPSYPIMIHICYHIHTYIHKY